MTEPGSESAPFVSSQPMTPERWRIVDTILQAALACEPDRRDRFVLDACGEDEALRREVSSLLGAHERMTNEFLEQPPGVGAPESSPTAPNDAAVVALGSALEERYTIEREIARGGMATVYLARDLRHGRKVAIKVMGDEVAAAVGAERFLGEIRVTALLQHPHILPLFDSGSVGGRLWYAMPFVEGETLRSRLTRERRLSVDEAVRIALEVADALEHAHARGIVHRDVKPENVLLQGGHALVADFGIALALEHAGGERLTRTGLTLGTPQYMAPEQAAGERALDARVDVYALGAMLYEMIIGEPPFAAPSRQAVLQRILTEPPTGLSGRQPGVAPWLDSAVRRALAKRPDERFPSAAEFAAALAVPANRAEAASPRAKASRSSGARGLPNGEPSRRVVAARVALYAALAGVAAGLVSGWGLAHASIDGSWASNAPARWRAETATAKAVVANIGQPAAPNSTDGLSLVVVDRAGRLQRRIDANRPWTPRFSPDGHRIAYGAFGTGRNTSDIWVIDLDAGKTQRVTDDDRDSNDPQWSPDGKVIAFSVSAPGGKDVASKPLAWSAGGGGGGGEVRMVASRDGTQFPSDWLRDGSALLVTDDASVGRHDILVQPTDGSAARSYVATTADETAARISPDGRWIAYTSDQSGQPEVYLDSYPRRRERVLISRGGGEHPVWRGDGRELYYWRGDALVAVQVGASVGSAPPNVDAQTTLLHAPYQNGLNTMYDVSPDGERFVIVERH